ncbi:helix-turn-helix domain-containing protein [Paenibacillus agricola]|uniref:AraC family transcriptional regulator n=1 Tax=Paenibacillus agricola TaxID=2716264 RepID=A0ABX0J0T5_9BACL|nr:helix-turn-helix domain-containing protein [Paenibacillus agricola]NHN29855.1 AraC family transcriptional regulator [Paenibacillus agricola]
MANWKKFFSKKLGIERLTNPKKYLYKLIWLGCISVCIPIILASLLYYQLSINRMEKYIQSESDSSLTIMKDRAERVLQEIEQDSLQLAKDPMLQEAYASSSNENVIRNIEILKKIALVKNSNSFINEIFLYNSSGNVILSNEYGPVSKLEYKYKDDIDRLLQSKRLTQWSQLSNREGYITFARMLPLIGNGGPEGILGFEIETSVLSKFLETNSVIVTGAQDLIIVKLHDPFGINGKLERELIRETAGLKGIGIIKASDKSSGNFVEEGFDGKPAQYKYVKNVFARTYVSVIPEQAVTEQLDWIRSMMVLILIVFIGVGIVLTYFTSKRAYTPIEQLINHSRSLSMDGIEHKENELDIIKESLDYLSKETEKLGSYMENIEPSLREKFLFQLLSGDYTRNETLIQDSGTYGIEVEFTNVVLIVEAENIYKEKRFLPEEKGIVAFSLANVMQEILRNHTLQGYAIPYQGRGAAILQFNSDMAQETMLSLTMVYVNAITEAFKKYLSFEVAVGIGRFYAHVADVPVSYKEAENALKYRIFRDSESVLFIEDVEHIKKNIVIRYPRESEAAILDALKQEDIPFAITNFKQFTEIIQSSQSYVFIYQSYHVLLSSLIVSLEKHGVNAADVIEHNLFGQLRSKMTSQEICDWFEETFFPLYTWLAQNDREATGDSAILLICKYISENCGKDLSLVQCAEMVGVSPSYLSRMFKKKMGKNFLEYVVESKIGEAMRLLRDTDQGISEVATAIGYSERNFIRIFQRRVQLTPGSYRGQYR